VPPVASQAFLSAVPRDLQSPSWSRPYRLPQVEEQIVLDELEVRVAGPEDHPRFQSLLRRRHYLQGIKPVGERLYYVAVWRGQWLALLVFCAAARHLRHRDKWIGLFLHWRGQDSKRAKSTLADFHEEMGLEHQRRAFALVNARESRALEAS
jgi:hypothetical protein